MSTFYRLLKILQMAAPLLHTSKDLKESRKHPSSLKTAQGPLGIPHIPWMPTSLTTSQQLSQMTQKVTSSCPQALRETMEQPASLPTIHPETLVRRRLPSATLPIDSGRCLPVSRKRSTKSCRLYHRLTGVLDWAVLWAR